MVLTLVTRTEAEEQLLADEIPLEYRANRRRSWHRVPFVC
jgi:protein-S-isoprenylcysteine O-methyltransferase Ste14